MKKIYSLALCCAVCLSASADGLRFKPSRTHARSKKAVTAAAPAPVWRPLSQIDYFHDGESWLEMGSVTFKYDNRGNRTEELVDEDGYLSKTVTTYNEFNLPVTIVITDSEDGDTWTNSGKTTYVYDTKVHDFFTDRAGYDWDGSDWTRNYRCEANTITRNDAGNIVEVVKSLPLFDQLKPAYKSSWNYGPDGKATEYFYYVIDASDRWELYDNLSYRDIVWEKTDGQMTVFGDLLELTEGNNLLKSAVVYYDGEPDGHYIVEYDGNGGFLIKETTNDINEIGRTTRMEITDANGSLCLTTTEYFDEEGTILTEPTYISVQEAIMDSHGNMIEFTEKEISEGVEETIASTIYTYTYDENGNTAEVFSEDFDYETQKYYPMERTVFGEYVNVASGSTGVTLPGTADWTVSGDDVTAFATGLTGLSVYTIQGTCVARATADASTATVSLSALAPGLYIVRADGTGAARRILRR